MKLNRQNLGLVNILHCCWIVFFLAGFILQNASPTDTSQLLGVMLCYYVGRQVNNITILITLFSIALAIAAAFSLFYLYHNILFFQESNFLSNSSSIMAIQFAIASTVALAILQNEKRLLFKILLISSACIFTSLIFLLESRTAIIAFMAGILFVYYPKFRQWFTKSRLLFISGSFLLLLILSLALLVKLDSSAGRWFIWKTSLQLFRQNWWCGTGIGLFNPSYNHLQADFFSTHTLYGSEAMLADDGYYAFNEWLHIGIEQGIVGLIFFLLLSFIALKACIRHINDEFSLAGAVLIPVFIACLFSYPLHNWLILFLSVFSLGVLATRSPVILPVRLPILIKISIPIILFFITCIIGYFHIRSSAKVKEATELEKEGYRTEAYHLAAKQAATHKSNPSFTIFYLNLLYETGRLEEAIQWFHQFHTYHCNQKAHAIVGKCYAEIGNLNIAEKHLLTSLYITPHRLQSRMDLLNFYNQKTDTAKAKYWANELINYPIKIPTDKALLLKNEAEKYLMSH